MSGEAQINLVCCTQVLLQDIGAEEVTQKDTALTYAMAIKSALDGADRPDWPTINQAIIERWGKRGLVRIKKLAWQHFRIPASEPSKE